MKRSGTEILIQSFVNHHVDTIFGYPGACIISILDSLYLNNVIRQVLVRHEQGAVYAACAYAQLSNKPGIVLVTSGPGATNTVAGIADAYSRGIPLIVITGQVSSNLLGTDAFQEADIVNITASITKWNCQIRKASDVAGLVDRAFYIATSGRPAPVLLDITKDAQSSMAEYVCETAFVRNDNFSVRETYLLCEQQGCLFYDVLFHLFEEAGKEIVLVFDKLPNDFYFQGYSCFYTVLRSGMLGITGFGLPAAIGAALVVSDMVVCLVVGALEFQAAMKELGVIKQEGLCIKIILLNDSVDGGFGIINPDFIQVAEAYGIIGERVSGNSDLHDSVYRMLNSDVSYLLEIVNVI